MMMYNDECRSIGGMHGTGNRSIQRNLVPRTLPPLQIPRELTRAETRDTAVRSWRLTAWAMARPSPSVTDFQF
jgi:hypothetical protein